MALNRSFQGGSTILADHVLQLIKLLEGDSGQGQAVSLVALDSGSAYTLDVRNLGAGGALRVRDTTGNKSLSFVDAGITVAWGTITTDQQLLSFTTTYNAAGVTFGGVLKVNVTDTASAAASLLADLQVGAASQWKVTKGGAVTQAGALTVVNGGASITGTTVTLPTDAVVLTLGTTNVATAGGIRLRNAIAIGWRNAAATANITIEASSADTVKMAGMGGLHLDNDAGYVQAGTTNPAASGAIRLRNATLIGWRNGAASADVTIGVDSTNRLALVNLVTATTIGAAGAASALPATPEGYLRVTVEGNERKIPFYLV